MASDHANLLRRLKRQGFSIEVRGSGHLRVTAPNGREHVTLPCSPGEYRSLKNSVALLKKIGYRKK